MKIAESRAILKSYVIHEAKKFFSKIGLGLTWRNRLVILENYHKSRPKLALIQAIAPNPLLALLEHSKSQIGQDLFVLAQTNYKRNGYFVEFGASNGVLNSNTYLLEKGFSWSGILVEPAKVWTRDLQKNRPMCAIETFIIWKESNSKINFSETSDPEYSTIDNFRPSDKHGKTRVVKKQYEVETISLLDLLKKNSAPKYIDYISIDTECSEFEILNAFNFTEFRFGIITVEHNRNSQRELIYALLTRNGYLRMYENLSDFHDWYVYNSNA